MKKISITQSSKNKWLLKYILSTCSWKLYFYWKLFLTLRQLQWQIFKSIVFVINSFMTLIVAWLLQILTTYIASTLTCLHKNTLVIINLELLTDVKFGIEFYNTNLYIQYFVFWQIQLHLLLMHMAVIIYYANGNKSIVSSHWSKESFDLLDALTIKIIMFRCSSFVKNIFIDLWPKRNL